MFLLGTLFATAGCSKSTTQTPLSGVNSAEFKSANGLSLSLSLDSTTYQPGQEVSIIINEKNRRIITNNVRVGDKLPSNKLSLESPFSWYQYPFGIAIFQGGYTSSNYSAATPLIIFEPNVYLGHSFMGPTSYRFHPSSDIANVEGSDFTSNSAQPIKCEITTEGYWPDNFQSAQRSDQQYWFTPGVYTVAAGDEWGALIVLHFTVLQ